MEVEEWECYDVDERKVRNSDSYVVIVNRGATGREMIQPNNWTTERGNETYSSRIRG